MKCCYIDKNKLEELAFRARIKLGYTEDDKFLEELNNLISFCSRIEEVSLFENNEKIQNEEMYDFRDDTISSSIELKDVFLNTDKFNSTYFLIERNFKN